MKDIILRRLAALQSGHLPQPVIDFILQELADVPPDEIETRITPEYLVAATGRAIEAMRQPKRTPEVRTRIVTIDAHCPVEEVRIHIDSLQQAARRLHGRERLRVVAKFTHKSGDHLHSHVVVQSEFPFAAGVRS
jgi:hypothetical protein